MKKFSGSENFDISRDSTLAKIAKLGKFAK